MRGEPFQMIGQILQRFKPSRRNQQVEMFHELLCGSKRVSKGDCAVDFGGIADDVVEMLNSSKAQTMIQEARETMEGGSLRKVDFGKFNTAKELEKGEVAAIEGTFALPMQKYSTGQAICVGIGSLSHYRPMQDSLHYWSSRILLSDATDAGDFIEREKRGLFGIYPTVYLRYYEVAHCLEVEEPYLFLDGPFMAADCQMNNPGHEIPFLLNRIDEEVRKNFDPRILKDRIAAQMAAESEELFFGETDGRDFR